MIYFSHSLRSRRLAEAQAVASAFRDREAARKVAEAKRATRPAIFAVLSPTQSEAEDELAEFKAETVGRRIMGPLDDYQLAKSIAIWTQA